MGSEKRTGRRGANVASSNAITLEMLTVSLEHSLLVPSSPRWILFLTEDLVPAPDLKTAIHMLLLSLYTFAKTSQSRK